MSNIERIKAIKGEIVKISNQIVENQFEMLEEKHELQKKRWILKRMLTAIVEDTDCAYLDLFKI